MALPVNGSTYLIPAYYSFYRPRKDERLSWLSWLTCSEWLTHISGHPSAAGRAQDRESLPAINRRSTTVPRHQLLPKNKCNFVRKNKLDIVRRVQFLTGRRHMRTFFTLGQSPPLWKSAPMNSHTIWDHTVTRQT